MIKLAVDTIDRNDLNKLIEWLQQEPIPKLTKGELTDKYEQEYAKSCGRKYSVFVNSGSSANLIAVYSLILSKKLKNNKVVIPALSWITTISPVIQFGLHPILCDVNLNNLSVDVEKLEDIFKKENPALLIIVPVLGLLPDLGYILPLCNKYRVELIIDCCEAQGSCYGGREIQSFGILSTCSSYFGHITSTIEGGMVNTDDEELYKILKSIFSHGWSRHWRKDQREKEKYKWNISENDELYSFFYPSFNVRNTEIGALLGIEQLQKLDVLIEKRNRNYLLFSQLIKNEYWKPKDKEGMFISNLGYPIIHPKRNTIMQALRDNDVECRPLISGSMGRQPFWIERYGRQEMMNASMISTNGLYVPNHAHISFEDVEFIANIVNSITCE